MARAGWDKGAADDAAWAEAVAREAVVRPLAEAERLGPSDIAVACRTLGLKRARIYGLIAAYRANPVASALLAHRPGMLDGTRRLPDVVEDVIAEAIATFYRSRQKPSVNALRKHLWGLCRQRSIALPSWQAIRARLDAMDPRGLVADREGAKAARERYRPAPGQYRADHALEVVQIDHTLVDLIVVDGRHRRPIQRPWLTLAIDVASRMVTGFHLTLEPPSCASVALAIHHSVVSKTAWLSGLGVTGAWPVAGLPDAIHVDNAKEFRSRALQRGVEEHGIALIHRPVATPHYGGHIERLIGTMMGAIHLLPGTTFSNVPERGNYESERHAAMTLAELERWLTLQIVGCYHAERHGTLGLPPVAAWHDAVALRPRPIRHPHDAQQLLLDLLPSVDRVVRRDGLRLFGLRYWDDVLSPWAGRLRRPVRVTYDPRDLSIVFVRGPDDRSWPVRFADLGRPSITLGEHRAAQAALRERGLRLVDEALIFDTIAQQRALVDEAQRQTKATRRLAERRERALDGAVTWRGRSPPEPALEPDTPIDFEEVGAYPVEEWS